MPLAAALAKCFWKLTGLSDGVWEEGKISPKSSLGLSLLGFCAPLSCSAVSHRIRPVGSEIGMRWVVHFILGGGAYVV